MKAEKKLHRRDFLRALGAGAAVTAPAPLVQPAEAGFGTVSKDEKRKARYEPNSSDVQSFYRVNRYPAKPN
ncbi:MAG: twin-arginine translocation signal domain-containing protein [Xanthobacteraceae bacterium]|jgi:hypothetical protein